MSGIININRVVTLMRDQDHYTYTRVKNLLKGLKGRSTKKDIQQVRKIINQELTAIDKTLADLEKQIKS